MVPLQLHDCCIVKFIRFQAKLFDDGGHSQTTWTRLGGWVDSQMSMIVHIRWLGGL